MGLHADKTAERDALTRKVEKLRGELEAYGQALTEAQDALDNTPDDEADDADDDGGVTAGGEAGANPPSVQVQDGA